jgi:hypothetical protein
MKRRNFDCNLYVAVDIEKVSAQSLPKMGIFRHGPETFERFSQK